MTAALEVTAGPAGGNFNAFIALMGNPRDFGESLHNARHILFSGSGAATGLQVEMVLSFGGGTTDLRLHGADGHLLADLTFKTIGFLPNPLFADSSLDSMMNAVQSATFGGIPGAIKFAGNVGNDSFAGGAGADTLAGGAGDDVLGGGGGNDSIFGGDGNDALTGGNGADKLAGKAGADVFVFGSATAANGDKISDFHLTDGDRIDLRGFDAIPGTVGLDAFTLIAGPHFGNHAGELLVISGTRTVVEGDLDGDGVADFSFVLAGVTELDASAFLFA